MAESPLHLILRHVRRLADGPVADHTDAELLKRFSHARDEAAFEAILRRHGPLVWGVCSRRLRDRHAAEDAFQATFLVLVRRAWAVRRPLSNTPTRAACAMAISDWCVRTLRNNPSSPRQAVSTGSRWSFASRR